MQALLVLWWNARGLVLWWNAREDVHRVDSGMEEGRSLLKKGCGRGASGSARLGPFGRDWARHCICRQASTTLLMSAGNRSGHPARPRPAPAPLGPSGGTKANAGRQFR